MAFADAWIKDFDPGHFMAATCVSIQTQNARDNTMARKVFGRWLEQGVTSVERLLDTLCVLPSHKISEGCQSKWFSRICTM